MNEIIIYLSMQFLSKIRPTRFSYNIRLCVILLMFPSFLFQKFLIKTEINVNIS